MSPEHGFVSSDNLQLHHLRWGAESGVPVVMLHGLRAYAQTWESLAAALGPAFCVYALDQRGRGNSDWGPVEDYRTEKYVEDLHAFADALKLESFILVGHSLGGTNALEFCRCFPGRVRALVIEDIGPGSSNRGSGAERIRSEMRNTPLSFSGWEEAEHFWRQSRPKLSDAGIQSRLRYSMKESGDGTVLWRHDQQGIAQARLSIEPIDLWPAVKSIHCPALLVRGGDSDFLPAATTEKIISINTHFECIEIPNASHYVHDDQPQLFNRAVTEFITRAASQGSSKGDQYKNGAIENQKENNHR